MKKRSKAENRKLVSVAVALLSGALLFLTVTAIPTPAMAGHNFAADNVSLVEADADSIELLRQSLDAESRGFDFTDNSFEFEIDSKLNETPEPEPTKRPPPSGRRSVNTDPTTRATTTTTTEAPTTTEPPATTRAPQPTQARAQAPATTAPAPAPTAAPVTTRAPVTTAAPTTAAPTTAAPTTTQAPGPVVDGSFNRSSCDEFIALLNQYRAANSVGALQKSGMLTGVAEKRSVEIVANFSHAGIANYGNYGENIFMGAGADRYNYASTALDAFKNSAGHNTNQLYSAYKYVGVGHYITPGGAHYWAVVFSF